MTEPIPTDPLQASCEMAYGYRLGNSEALRKVFMSYSDDVARLARLGFTQTRPKLFRISGIEDSDQQLDLVHECFARAFSATARRAYNDQYPFRPYLLRIAKNLMIDRARKYKQKQRLFSSEPYEEA